MDRRKHEHLAAQADMMQRCFRCGLCKTACPSFRELGDEAASPRGRVQFARAVCEGRAELSGGIERHMLDCLNCMACAETCPADVRTDRIVLAARAELAGEGRLNPVKKLAFRLVVRHPRIMRLAAVLGGTGQRLFYRSSTFLQALVPRLIGMDGKRFLEPATRRPLDYLPRVMPAKDGEPVMRAAYFIGCATNLLYPENADATVEVLTRNGVEVHVPQGQVCCGIPVYTSGDMNTARKLAERNKRVFGGLENIDCIVTDCASCSAALKHEIAEIVGVEAFNVPVYDINELLVNHLELDRRFGGVPMRVTYHDPCHLARGQDIRSEPRQLLRMVPGVEFVEMEDADVCCGGAGTFSYTHHDLSRRIGARKAENIRATGAEAVATPCPSCTMQLADVCAAGGLAVEIVHPVRLLADAYRAYVEPGDRGTAAAGKKRQSAFI